jgi:hypothetical protein
VLDITVSDGGTRRLPLQPRSVADFYAAVMAALNDLGVGVAINEKPCEIAGATPFSQDRMHAAYDPDYAQRFWQVLLQTDRVLKNFRTGFLGKCSPVHFFWGSFDLAVTRFSGRPAPPFAGTAPGVAPEVMREAYSHEVSSRRLPRVRRAARGRVLQRTAGRVPAPLRNRPNRGRSGSRPARLPAKHLRSSRRHRTLGPRRARMPARPPLRPPQHLGACLTNDAPAAAAPATAIISQTRSWEHRLRPGIGLYIASSGSIA